MFLQKQLITNIILVIFLLLQFHMFVVDAACEGSVIFYWKETPNERQSEQRNWGVLEKEIDKSQGILSKFMDTNNTYSFTKMGDCCWEVYSKNFYQGESATLVSKLPSGYGGIPGYPQFKANSLKKIPC